MNFKILEKTGEGSFSTVFMGEDKEGRKVAIKKITRTTSPVRISNELKFLIRLQKVKNIIEILDIYREGAEIFIVFPFIEITDFKLIIEKSKFSEIKNYMFELLTAIQSVHSEGIIHRDIKPSNFLYNLEKKTGYLIDFGLSQQLPETETTRKQKKRFFFSSHSTGKSKITAKPPGYLIKDPRPSMNGSRSGTRGFKAPEILFRIENQSQAIDIWSAGVIFLCLLSKRYPFFTSKDDVNTLVEIASLFGDEEMRKAAKEYNRTWKSNIETCRERVSFRSLIDLCNLKHVEMPDSAVDLLEKMLELRASQRIRADEALRHPFFID